MFFYVENSKTKRAYADQELAAWDRIKGALPDAVIATRTEKQMAVEAALAVELTKGEVDLKNPPKEITDKEAELKAALAAELTSHQLTKWDAAQQKAVPDDLSEPTYACEWDGLAPYVTTLTGTFPAEGIPIMGWPQRDTPPDSPKEPTQEEIDAANAAAEAKQAARANWQAEALAQMQISIEAYEAWAAANPYPV